MSRAGELFVMIRVSLTDAAMCIVAASGPTIWTSRYGLEPVLCNRLLIEPSGWTQTVHMFIQRLRNT